VTCTPASGSTFPLGTTTVNCSAKDAAGNTATGSFTVTVRDTTPPSVGSPASITAEATSAAGAVVTYTTPTATDTVGPASPAVSCSPASGSTFPLGTTTVTCSATDTAGNTGSSTFTITVQDTTAPVLSLPAPVAEATGPAGAVVTYIATASDVVDGPLTPTCSPPSGSTFALGATTVNCSATDAAHNTATGSFTVTVRDTTPPTISNVPGPITAEATSGSGAAVTYSLPTASDLVDGTVGVTCSPASGSTFALGATTVNCSAKDAAGNTAGASFTVTVVDTTPPTLSLPADMQVAATGPNGATATFSASASDLVDGAVAVTCTPASGSTFAIGVTTVNCSATDAHGNVATGSFTIQVTYQLVGFYQPADPSPFAPTTIVWNTIKGGSVVPLKFEVFAGSTELTSTSIVQQPLKIVSIACTTGVEDLVEESLAAGTTSLRYDATAGQFIFNWQTPKKPGTCYKAYVSVLDGAGSAPNSTINAYFKIK
jgi:hypothetical protein